MSDTKIIHLNPCPFCGGDAEIKMHHCNSGMDGSYVNWIVICKKCGANIEKAADNFYGRYFFTPEDVAMIWNKRI